MLQVRRVPAPRAIAGWAVAVCVSCAPAAGFCQAASYTLFESVPVRPLALSADASHLYAVNTHDGRVEIFSVGGGGALTSVGEVQVGLEPVAVAARGNTEVWVSNHLSDSVSRVDVSDPANPRVTATVEVGDEPRDIVIGGSARDKVFVACARRGQHRPGDAGLTTPGLGRTDVWVIDAGDPSASPAVVSSFGDTPRALAVSPDGSQVYVAVLNSGNQTTVIREPVVTAGGGVPPPPPGFTPNPPRVGLIVKWDGAKWTDEIGRNWNAAVPYTVADRDVFVLDADADPPAQIGFVTGVGSMLFNMAVNPASGDLFVTSQNARNEVRFEPVLTGHLAEQNVTIISGTTPTAVHLNPHIDYGQPGSPGERALSVGLPLDIVFASSGARAYIAGFGSSNVAVIDAAGAVTARIDVGGGPAGLALDEGLGRLFVLNTFDRTISTVDTSSNTQIATTPVRYDPEPASVREGRRFLYDTKLTSRHGDNSCGTCHFSADMDRAAWDLGDPFGAVVANPNPFPIIGTPVPFHPMKGPMTTQSLRGMLGAGPMHWRGDRNGGAADPANEDLSFKAFNPAFVGLLGRDTQLSTEQMQAYTDFILQVRYPPNPVAALDGTLTASQAAGAQLFVQGNHDLIATCEGCHNLPFGTGGFPTFEGEPQNFKVAHLRNAYAKIGLFRNAAAQVSETGFLHDGGVASVFEFLGAPVFQLSDQQQRDLESFTLAFDTGLAPAVGQQITADAISYSSASVIDFVETLRGRDENDDCELVAKGRVGGAARGYVYIDGGFFRPDRNGEALIPYDDLRAAAAAPGQEITYTCVYPGGGQRIGVDRDMDGYYDRTEADGGADPASPSSTPSGASACGDGSLDTGEQCDGAAFGGATCRSVGFAGGALGCDSACLRATGACTAAASEFNGRVLRISKLTAPAGSQKITVRSDQLRGSGFSFDPTGEDFVVTFYRDDAAIWEATIPAGDPGWRTSTGNWSWKASAGVHPDGLRSVKVGRSGGSPFTFSLKAADADAASALDATSLDVLTTIGDDGWAGTTACAASGSGATLKCR